MGREAPECLTNLTIGASSCARMFCQMPEAHVSTVRYAGCGEKYAP